MATENNTTDQIEEENGEASGTTGLDPVAALVACALEQEDYTEKSNVNDIDLFSEKPGSGNYTKYARDLCGDNTTMVGDQTFNDYYQIPADGIYYGNKQSVAWCAMFVDWCFCMTFGYEAMQLMTFHGLDGAGVSNCRSHYKANGRFITSGPQPGDEVFFDGHTGLVYDVDEQYVYTIEGNTSSRSGVVSEGGCVAKKQYSLGSGSIIGYGRPDWSKAPPNFLYRGSGAAFGTDYINAYITSCTKDNLSITISSFSAINASDSSIGCKLYEGSVDIKEPPEGTPVDPDEGMKEIEKNEYKDIDSTPKLKGLYNEGKLAKIEIDISKLPPNELVTLKLSVSNASGTSEIGLGFTTPQAYPKQVQNVQITAMRYSYDTVFDTNYRVYFTRLNREILNGEESDWGYWKDKKGWDCGYTVYLIKNRKIHSELFNFGDSTVNLPTNLYYTSGSFYFDLNKVLLDQGIKDLRELDIGSNIQIGVRTWVRGKYIDEDEEEVQLSLPELPKGSNTLQLDFKTNVTNRCYFNLDGKYARLSIHKNNR